MTDVAKSRAGSVVETEFDPYGVQVSGASKQTAGLDPQALPRLSQCSDQGLLTMVRLLKEV